MAVLLVGGGLGGQMILTLEDECEAKINNDLAKI